MEKENRNMAANQDDKLKPGGKLSDGDRFITSPEKPQTQEEKGAEVVRSMAAVKAPHINPESSWDKHGTGWRNSKKK
jgi:hypothetical protein